MKLNPPKTTTISVCAPQTIQPNAIEGSFDIPYKEKAAKIARG